MSTKFVYPKFPAAKESLHVEMKRRVQEYFQNTKTEQHGSNKILSKAIIIMVAFVAVYLFLLIASYPWYIGVLGAVVLGLLVALIGFNIMHDGGHGSFSDNPAMNKLASYSGSLMGASQFMWSMKHNVIHHTYTNVEGVDDDIEAGALLRMGPHQRYFGYHKIQHFYFWILYTQLYSFWVFYTDYKKYFTKKIGNVPIKKMSKSDHIRFWLVKLNHAILYIVIPILAVGWLKWLVGFVIMSAVSGFVLSIVFQLAHTVDGNHFPEMEADTNKLPMEFAEHQLETTANFATKNKFWTWALGGLNFQVEHHLFPKISHVHYPAISKIVKQVCEERNITYREAKTMRQAIASHIHFLKTMGKRPAVLPLNG